MNRRQQTEAQALLRANEFVDTRLTDFTHQPPTKVDLKVGTAQTKLTTAVNALGGKQAIQASGAFGQETAKQGILRDELMEELKDINTTAAAIAEETDSPSIMKRFRMPHGASPSELAAATHAMAAAIRELSLNDEFEAHAHPADTAAALDELADDYELGEAQQGLALGQQTGATATIPEALRSGKSAVKTLNAIFRRIYKGNLEVLTAWKTATHVQRAPKPSAPPATPPPPAP